MLNTTLADALDIAAVNAQESVQSLDTLGRKNVYQVVQEAGGATRFLSKHSRLEDAMQKARFLNRQTGKAYKTVLWGSGLPVQRGPAGTHFRGDNILPSYVIHPAAVESHPDVLPISAIYKRGAEVIFTPTGEGVPAWLDRFVVEGDAGSKSGVPFHQALQLASKRARRTGNESLITVARKGETSRTPTLRVMRAVQQGAGLSEVTIDMQVAPVLPAELALRRARRRAL